MKIYKIIDNTNGNVYVGKTKQKKLSNRISGHRTDFKRNTYCSSSKILCNDDWRYELIEETDDDTREEYWINNTPNCINQRRLNFNKENYDTEYHEKHRERYKKQSKDRYNKNKNDIKYLYYFVNSWGGDPRSNNNLLKIDINIFN